MKVAVDSSNTNEIQSLSQVLIQDSSAHQRIKNLFDPVDLQDASTKSFVDAQVAKLIDLSIHYHTLRHYLIKHFNTKLKQPRKSHIKKDKKATETFLKTSSNL